MYTVIFIFSFIWAILNLWFYFKFGIILISKKGWEWTLDSPDNKPSAELLMVATIFVSCFLVILLIPTLWLGIAAYSPAICTVLLSIYPPKINIKDRLRKWLLDEKE